MEFAAAADKYDRFMGRYTRSLAPALADAAGVTGGMRVLDVGCGPGILMYLLHEVGVLNPASGPPAIEYMKQYHTTASELAEIAVKAKPKLLVLYHPVGRVLPDDVVATITATFKGRVVFGRDLDLF